MKIKQFLIAVCVGTMFAACSNKEDYGLLDDNTIKLRAEVVPISCTTRSLESNTPPYSFYGGAIGVYFYKTASGESFGNDLSIVNSDGTVEMRTPAEWPDESIFIYAIAPSTHGLPSAGNEITHTVKTDQTSVNDYIESDFLLAQEKDLTKSGGAVTLHFKHMLSKIIVKLTSSLPDIDITQAKNICLYCANAYDLKRDASNNLTLEGFNQPPVLIKLGDYSPTGVTGIVPPQSIYVDGSYSISFTIGETTYTYTPTPSEWLIESGYSYTFTLDVNQSNINVKTYQVEEWIPKNQSGTVVW